MYVYTIKDLKGKKIMKKNNMKKKDIVNNKIGNLC